MKTLLFVFATAAVAAAQVPSEQSVDAVFSAYNKPDSPGCALAVIKDGSIVYKRGYGQADLAHDIPLTPNAVFHVASSWLQTTQGSSIIVNQSRANR